MSRRTQTPDDADAARKRLENERWDGGFDSFGISPSKQERWEAVLAKHCEEHGLALPRTDAEWALGVALIQTWRGLPTPKGPAPTWGGFQLAVLRLEYLRLRDSGLAQGECLSTLQSRPPWSQMIPNYVDDRGAYLLEKTKKKSKNLDVRVCSGDWDALLAKGDWAALEALADQAAFGQLASALRGLERS